MDYALLTRAFEMGDPFLCVSFDFQLGVRLFLSVILGLALHLTYRSSAKNQP